MGTLKNLYEQSDLNKFLFHLFVDPYCGVNNFCPYNNPFFQIPCSVHYSLLAAYIASSTRCY